jgi:hypothetical protein
MQKSNELTFPRNLLPAALICDLAKLNRCITDVMFLRMKSRLEPPDPRQAEINIEFGGKKQRPSKHANINIDRLRLSNFKLSSPSRSGPKFVLCTCD